MNEKTQKQCSGKFYYFTKRYGDTLTRNNIASNNR